MALANVAPERDLHGQGTSVPRFSRRLARRHGKDEAAAQRIGQDAGGSQRLKRRARAWQLQG
jgi:hypothetical protein